MGPYQGPSVDFAALRCSFQALGTSIGQTSICCKDPMSSQNIAVLSLPGPCNVALCWFFSIHPKQELHCKLQVCWESLLRLCVKTFYSADRRPPKMCPCHGYLVRGPTRPHKWKDPTTRISRSPLSRRMLMFVLSLRRPL